MRMAIDTKANLTTICDTAMALCTIVMVTYMRAIGNITKKQALDGTSQKMVIYLRDIGYLTTKKVQDTIIM